MPFCGRATGIAFRGDGLQRGDEANIAGDKIVRRGGVA